MTKFRIFAVLLVFLTVAPVYAQKIAFVDTNEVQEQWKEAAAKKKEIKALEAKGRKEIEDKLADLKKFEEKAKKEASMATPEALSLLQEQYNKKLYELQQLQEAKKQEIMDVLAPLNEKYIKKIKEVSMKIALQKGYDVVLMTEAALYYDSKFDITKAVIAEINK